MHIRIVLNSVGAVGKWVSCRRKHWSMLPKQSHSMNCCILCPNCWQSSRVSCSFTGRWKCSIQRMTSTYEHLVRQVELHDAIDTWNLTKAALWPHTTSTIQPEPLHRVYYYHPEVKHKLAAQSFHHWLHNAGTSSAHQHARRRPICATSIWLNPQQRCSAGGWWRSPQLPRPFSARIDISGMSYLMTLISGYCLFDLQVISSAFFADLRTKQQLG